MLPELSDQDRTWYIIKGYEIEEDLNGRIYYMDGEFHREDGPAVEYADGTKYWYLNGKYHREDGPAIEYADGTREWLLNGKTHREDGPAIEWADGRRIWYLNGKLITEEEHQKAVKEIMKNAA